MLTPLLLVSGIGEGTLTILITIVIAIIGCLLAMRSTENAGKLGFVSALLPTLTILFFVYVDKEDGSVEPEVYDETYLRRWGVVGFLLLFVIFSVVFLMLEFCLNQMQGYKVAGMYTAQ